MKRKQFTAAYQELTITEQAEILGISRLSLYYHPKPPSSEDVTLKHRIDEMLPIIRIMGPEEWQLPYKKRGKYYASWTTRAPVRYCQLGHFTCLPKRNF
jgi:hypothetical protein